MHHFTNPLFIPSISKIQVPHEPPFPELRTLHLSGFDRREHIPKFELVAPRNIRRMRSSFIHAKLSLNEALFNVIIRAKETSGNKLFKIALSHGLGCGKDYQCFWEDFEIIIRKNTKRLSYINDSFLDTHEDHVYVHEIAEPDVTGISTVEEQMLVYHRVMRQWQRLGFV
jgi:hypothetical protein